MGPPGTLSDATRMATPRGPALYFGVRFKRSFSGSIEIWSQGVDSDVSLTRTYAISYWWMWAPIRLDCNKLTFLEQSPAPPRIGLRPGPTLPDLGVEFQHHSFWVLSFGYCE